MCPARGTPFYGFECYRKEKKREEKKKFTTTNHIASKFPHRNRALPNRIKLLTSVGEPKHTKSAHSINDSNLG